MIKNKH